MSAWTVTYVYSSDKAASPGKKGAKPKYRITSVKFEKTGDVYHRITYWDTGKQTEAWSVGGRQVIKDQSDSEYVPASAMGPLADNFEESDFEDLAWVSRKFYAGLKEGEYSGFVFRAKHKDRPLTRREKITYEILKRLRSKNGEVEASAQAGSSEEEVAVDTLEESPNDEDVVTLDATTQLPVQYDLGPIRWTYQFTEPPTKPLELPPSVSALMEKWNTFIKSSETTGSPP